MWRRERKHGLTFSLAKCITWTISVNSRGISVFMVDCHNFIELIFQPKCQLMVKNNILLGLHLVYFNVVSWFIHHICHFDQNFPYFERLLHLRAYKKFGFSCKNLTTNSKFDRMQNRQHIRRSIKVQIQLIKLKWERALSSFQKYDL